MNRGGGQLIIAAGARMVRLAAAAASYTVACESGLRSHSGLSASSRETRSRADRTLLTASSPDSQYGLMVTSPTDLPTQYFRAKDGQTLAYREMGEGRPIVLIHGLFSTGTVNWIRYGHAARIAERGYRVVMPDLRGHGDSAKPHDPSAYPPDILADDGLALIEHLGLTDYDLGGYSLGARTTVRMLVRRARPARAIVAGIGFEGIVDTERRAVHFRRILTHLGTFERGSAEWMAEAFLKTVGGDPVALLHVLDTSVDTSPSDLRQIQTPTLVLMGDEDRDTGSGEDLAAALPKGKYGVIPGNHMSAVTKPDLGSAIAEFLGSP